MDSEKHRRGPCTLDKVLGHQGSILVKAWKASRKSLANQMGYRNTRYDPWQVWPRGNEQESEALQRETRENRNRSRNGSTIRSHKAKALIFDARTLMSLQKSLLVPITEIKVSYQSVSRITRMLSIAVRSRLFPAFCQVGGAPGDPMLCLGKGQLAIYH